MQMKRENLINFQPIGKRIKTTSEETILNAAQNAGLDIASICGGIGICDSCRVRLIDGKLSEPTTEEIDLFTENELSSGFRLACQSHSLSDVTIEIPPESLTAPQRLQIEGQFQTIDINPAVVALDIRIPEPTLTDLRSDTTRISDKLKQNGFVPPITYSQPVLEGISSTLRDNNWHVKMAMRNNNIVAILPPTVSLLGLAVDVGTTKLAAYLCDLKTGQIITKMGAMNPQTSFGEDVISRISYTNNVLHGSKLLQKRLIEALNQLIQDMCVKLNSNNYSITPNHIVEAVVVGNTAMHHLFAGLPVHQLGTAPYVPAVGEALVIDTDKVGLNISPGAKIYLPPNIAGYVGADHVAMLLSTGIWSTPKTSIALDIGTNTEISLAYNNQIIACSCASGPAFEGAHIRAGMRAAPGAIERVQIIQGELRTQSIDNQAPIGICGSGILDAIACMHQIGAIDHRGTLHPNHPLVKKRDNNNEFVLVKGSNSGNGQDIIITRQDVNEIQLAKGAIRTGIEVLLENAGISADAIEEFIIAGAFGTYINIPSAIEIGMFPQLPLDRFRQVGNAAGDGARRMLLSVKQRSLAEEIAKGVRYIELSTYPNFTSVFSKSLFI